MVRVHNRSIGTIFRAAWGLGVLAGGCGGQYHLTAADQLAVAGGQAATVARLTRQEFWLLRRSVKQAPLRFYVDDQPQRAAFTDRKGYAAANVPVPQDPGVYQMVLAYQDLYGEEIWVQAPTYVWPEQANLAAVDLDAIDLDDAAAVAGLCDLAQQANIVYLATQSAAKASQQHGWLQRAGLPDGPILHWNKRKPDQAIGQLAQVKSLFSGLSVGVGDRRSVTLFEQAHLEARRLSRPAPPSPASAPAQP